MNLPYKPQDIREIFCLFIWVYWLSWFYETPYDIIENYIEYEKFIIERIKKY